MFYIDYDIDYDLPLNLHSEISCLHSCLRVIVAIEKFNSFRVNNRLLHEEIIEICLLFLVSLFRILNE